MKAEALTELGRKAEAHLALEKALKASEAIPDKMMRDMKVGMISNSLKAMDKAAN